MKITSIEPSDFINDSLSSTCPVCSKNFESLRGVYKVPVFNPDEALEPKEISRLIGRYFHIDCWQSHGSFSTVTSLAIKALSEEFGSSKNEIFSERGVAFWCKRHGDIGFENGGLYLPCSSFIFKNLMGGDVEGSIIRGNKLELEALIAFILDDRFGIGFLKEDETLFLECVEEFDKSFLIKVDSCSKNLKGYLCLSSSDRQLLSLVVKR